MRNAEQRGKHESDSPQSGEALPTTPQADEPLPATPQADDTLPTTAHTCAPLEREGDCPPDRVGHQSRDVRALPKRRVMGPARAGEATRLSSAAVDEAASVQPTPLPTPAAGARITATTVVVDEDVITPHNGLTIADLFPLAPSLRSPEPRIVKLVDRRSRVKQRLSAQAPSLHAATPTPMLRRPKPLATSDELLGVRDDDDLRPVPLVPTAATPEPFCPWDPHSAAAVTRKPPASFRAPMHDKRADTVDDVKVYYEHRKLNLAPLTTPAVSAAAVLKLQQLRDDEEERRIRRLQPLSPADQRRRGLLTSTQATGVHESKGGVDEPTAGAAAHGNNGKPAKHARKRRQPAYVAPRNKRLAPPNAVPVGPDGKPLFDMKKAKRRQRKHALSLREALEGPTGAASSTRQSAEKADDDPVAAAVQSIPAALRRHMRLPESKQQVATRETVDAKMRRFRQETQARLNARQRDIDNIVLETAQRQLFEVQRKLYQPAKATADRAEAL
jgi:hypothetical protein